MFTAELDLPTSEVEVLTCVGWALNNLLSWGDVAAV